MDSGGDRCESTLGHRLVGFVAKFPFKATVSPLTFATLFSRRQARKPRDLTRRSFEQAPRQPSKPRAAPSDPGPPQLRNPDQLRYGGPYPQRLLAGEAERHFYFARRAPFLTCADKRRPPAQKVADSTAQKVLSFLVRTAPCPGAVLSCPSVPEFEGASVLNWGEEWLTNELNACYLIGKTTYKLGYEGGIKP
jgi:hypothetical protein